MDTPFHSIRLAVLYLMPQGWRYFESQTGELDELEAAFWAPAPAIRGAIQRHLDRQASQRLARAMNSGEIVVVLVGSHDDQARLVSLLPEGVRTKVAARLDPPHPRLSRQELGLLVRQVAPPQPFTKG